MRKTCTLEIFYDSETRQLGINRNFSPPLTDADRASLLVSAAVTAELAVGHLLTSWIQGETCDQWLAGFKDSWTKAFSDSIASGPPEPRGTTSQS